MTNNLTVIIPLHSELQEGLQTCGSITEVQNVLRAAGRELNDADLLKAAVGHSWNGFLENLAAQLTNII